MLWQLKIALFQKIMGMKMKIWILYVASILLVLFLQSCDGGGGSGGVPPNSSTPIAPGTMMGGAILGTELNLTTAVTTIAGNGSYGGAVVDGAGTTATLGTPLNITTDGANLYVADASNNRIRQIVIATYIVSTLAGGGGAGNTDAIGANASFNRPKGITTDGANLYVADTYNQKIRMIVIASGVVTTLAGSGSIGSADGTGVAATFNYPTGITTDGSNLYVSDTANHIIRKITIATGAVSTLSGSGSAGSGDGIGTVASFDTPKGITTDGVNLYVAEVQNNTIRKIVIATGLVSTFAGSGAFAYGDGIGTAASFYHPYGITTDGTNLYVADDYNEIIRKIVIATRAVTTLAGSPGMPGSADGTGTEGSFSYPNGITTDGVSLYVGDSGNHTIRMIK